MIINKNDTVDTAWSLSSIHFLTEPWHLVNHKFLEDKSKSFIIIIIIIITKKHHIKDIW